MEEKKEKYKKIEDNYNITESDIKELNEEYGMTSENFAIVVETLKKFPMINVDLIPSIIWGVAESISAKKAASISNLSWNFAVTLDREQLEGYEYKANYSDLVKMTIKEIQRVWINDSDVKEKDLIAYKEALKQFMDDNVKSGKFTKSRAKKIQ